jgi:hypothetical protein
VEAHVRNEHEVEIGDLVFMDRDAGGVYTLPASQVSDFSSLEANQTWFKCHFLGVAMQAHRANHDPLDDNTIRVATKGVFEFDCVSATWDIGNLVGVAENAAGTALLNQTVVEVPLAAVDRDARTIGIVQRQVNVAATTVYIRIRSEIMEQGFDADSCSGSSSSGE